MLGIGKQLIMMSIIFTPSSSLPQQQEIYEIWGARKEWQPSIMMLNVCAATREGLKLAGLKSADKLALGLDEKARIGASAYGSGERRRAIPATRGTQEIRMLHPASWTTTARLWLNLHYSIWKDVVTKPLRSDTVDYYCPDISVNSKRKMCFEIDLHISIVTCFVDRFMLIVVTLVFLYPRVVIPESAWDLSWLILVWRNYW